MASNSDTPGADADAGPGASAVPEGSATECSTAGTKLTPTALGKVWGTSRAYASKCIKKGCPVHSIEAANQWRQAKARYGVGYRSKHKPPGAEPALGASNSHNGAGNAGEESEVESAEGENGSDQRAGAGGLESLERSLRKAISVENEAHRLVAEAQKARNDDTIAIRIAAYTKAQKGRLDAEEQIVKLQEKMGLLIPADKAKALIRRSFLPLLTRLRSLPKRAAFKANPVDDVHAEAVLKAEIEEVIAEWRGLYRGERRKESLRKDEETSAEEVARE